MVLDFAIRRPGVRRFASCVGQEARSVCAQIHKPLGPKGIDYSPQGDPAGCKFGRCVRRLLEACRDVHEEGAATHVVARTDGDIE